MLWETIQSILAGEAIPTEIVVVDQSDRPNESLAGFQPQRPCTFRYLWSDRRGVSAGRNLAIAAASHSILVITDDDMFFPPEWFSSLVQTLIDNGVRSVVTGRVLPSQEETSGFAPSILEDEDFHVYQGRIQRDVLSSGNMAMYRSAFDEAGLFDERLGPGTPYPAAEDNDLGFRFLEAGYRILYEPAALVYHRAWRSEKEFLKLHWEYGIGQGAFYAKHFSITDTHMVRRMLRVMFNHIIRLPYRTLFDRTQAQLDARFIAGMLMGAMQWTLRRRGNQA
jgi:GT2 family glycosyltransferase